MQALDNDTQPLTPSHYSLQNGPGHLGCSMFTLLHGHPSPRPLIPAPSQTLSHFLSQTNFCLSHKSRIVADESIAVYVFTRSRATHYEHQRK
jgi:hypothetical protein